MKKLTTIIKESVNIKFENKELVNLFLNLKSNKQYKKLGILTVKLSEDTEENFNVEIETKNAVHSISVAKDLNNVYQLHGCLTETAYEEIDELLLNLYKKFAVCEWTYETEQNWSNEQILDEVISQMNDDEVGAIFKKLYKVYSFIDKTFDELENTESNELLCEMLQSMVEINRR